MSLSPATPRHTPPPTAGSGDALRVQNVDVVYRVRGRDVPILRDLSFRIARGESYGLLGESGSGKSTMALAAIRYLARNGRVRSGEISVDGQDVLAMNGAELRRLRAGTVSMVYQEPGRALNPTIRVGRQVAEVYEIAGLSRGEAMSRTRDILERVQIPDVAAVMDRYPHQLSGGMLQRAVIAMALAAEPALLILDEPTTALDASVEAEVLDLIDGLRAEFSTSLLFISHNLGVIARMCDRAGVLYAGELVEEGPARELFADPHHPYTVGLLRCIPRRDTLKRHAALDTIPGFPPAPGQLGEGCVFADRCGLVQERCRVESPPLYPVSDGRASRCHFYPQAQNVPRAEPLEEAPAGGEEASPLLRVRHTSKTFRFAGQTVHGLSDVSLELREGETLGLVGESGSGKTTLARVLLGLTAPDEGSEVLLGEEHLAGSSTRRSRAQQKALQIVFQNPDSALNRRHSVRRLISRALARLGGYHGDRLQARLTALITAVRLTERQLPLRPAQLSGGLKQRVAIARAFAGDPTIVVCDEPTSALDVSVQAAILNLLTDLQRRERVSYLFISHDLGVVRYLSDRIAVMYLGRLMELGSAEQVFNAPHHPYTEALLSAVPTLDDVLGAKANGRNGRHGSGRGERIRLEGEIPSAANPPSGCVFHTRCPRKIGAICETEVPALDERAPGHAIACHIPIDELRRLQAAGAAGDLSQEAPPHGGQGARSGPTRGSHPSR